MQFHDWYFNLYQDFSIKSYKFWPLISTICVSQNTMDCTAFSSGLFGDLFLIQDLVFNCLEQHWISALHTGAFQAPGHCGRCVDSKAKTRGRCTPCGAWGWAGPRHYLSDYFAISRHLKFMAKALTLFPTTGPCKTYLTALLMVTWAVTAAEM